MNSPISLYDPDGKLVTAFADGGSLPRLPAGESHTWQGQYAVKQSQLDEGKLVYTLRYNTKDALGAVVEQNLPATAIISFTGERVDLKVNRTITPEVVRRGKEVTIIYDLVNQGNVKLTNIDIQEKPPDLHTQAVHRLPGAGRQRKDHLYQTKRRGRLDQFSINYLPQGR